MGVVSFGLTLSQPVLAVLRNGTPGCSKERQHNIHHIWHWVHGIAGYGALGTAVIAVALGIEEYVRWSINPSVGRFIESPSPRHRSIARSAYIHTYIRKARRWHK